MILQCTSASLVIFNWCSMLFSYHFNHSYIKISIDEYYTNNMKAFALNFWGCYMIFFSSIKLLRVIFSVKLITIISTLATSIQVRLGLLLVHSAPLTMIPSLFLIGALVGRVAHSKPSQLVLPHFTLNRSNSNFL